MGAVRCPKNLAVGILNEVAGLAEHFQWLTEEKSRQLPPEGIGPIREEIGDVLCVVNLSDNLGIDRLQAAWDKMQENRDGCPADRARGQASKPTRWGSKRDGAAGRRVRQQESPPRVKEAFLLR